MKVDTKICILTLLVFGIAAAAYAQNPTPIPQQSGALPVPEFIGSPATPKHIFATTIPRNPYMAPNGQSNTHDDTYGSDTYEVGGPLGIHSNVLSSYLGTQADPIAECATVTFDHAGRIVTVCIGSTTVRLFLIDSRTLETLASLDLPPKPTDSVNFSGGGYFFLDNLDRAVIPTTSREMWVVPEAGASFSLPIKYDLSSVVPEGDGIESVLPDFTGRLWFVTEGGLVGTLDSTGNLLGTMQLEDEKITNSFSVDQWGGVFIASDHAMYRFDAGAHGQPVITWREAYDRGTRTKPGQMAQGTGTTPTLMGNDYVTITDNADPYMHVLVYKRPKEVNGDRLVCSEPVFQDYEGATENSLIATDKSIIVENNYGYSSYTATMNGATTEPGVTRIDLDERGGCHTVWTNNEVSVPSVVSKMSLRNGLVYTYSKPVGPGTTDPWYFTALDFYTGETVFEQLAGTGFYYNNNYSGLYLGPDGKTEYVGVAGGLVAMHDRD
jgi:hypothetical protein